MKRSEVIKLLANWAHPTILSDVYSNNYQEWADNLLYTLETEYGMQPPFTGLFEQQNIVDRCGVSTGRVEMIRVIVNKWEPEDEKQSSES